MTTQIRIATRCSPLALAQSQWVGHALCAAHPTLEVVYVPILTEGDRHLSSALMDLGGKGLFTKALEEAIFERRADIAVHSMKDMPVNLPDGLCVGAISKREDARDMLVARTRISLLDLPAAACVGTSSVRRQLQAKRLRPDLELKLLRGNIDTRLASLNEGHFDAIILAAAGLHRLQLSCEATPLDPLLCIPAPGQGALAIECLSDANDILSYITALHDRESAVCVMAERACTAFLGGGCHAPIGVYAILENNDLILRACLGTPDAQHYIEVVEVGSIEDPIAVGETAARSLLANGGHSIMEILANTYA